MESRAPGSSQPEPSLECRSARGRFRGQPPRPEPLLPCRSTTRRAQARLLELREAPRRLTSLRAPAAPPDRITEVKLTGRQEDFAARLGVGTPRCSASRASRTFRPRLSWRRGARIWRRRGRDPALPPHQRVHAGSRPRHGNFVAAPLPGYAEAPPFCGLSRHTGKTPGDAIRFRYRPSGTRCASRRALQLSVGQNPREGSS